VFIDDLSNSLDRHVPLGMCRSLYRMVHSRRLLAAPIVAPLNMRSGIA
jgi:hypothetical protein